MIKDSTQLIALAKECVEKELERSIERRKQPSFYEIFYAGYSHGVADATDADPKELPSRDQWHWIETEGLPPTDDKCWCLIRCDGYYDTEMGHYEDGRWWFTYYPPQMREVVAWHALPQIPEIQPKDIY